jgi:hypothetical protein
MRPAVAIAASVAASLVWTACSLAGPATPITIDLGKAFSLKVGEVAQSREAGVQVGFEGVTADSRCPKGVRCVWAGDAVARVWLQRGTGPRERLDLHTAPGAAQAAGAMGHELRLQRLDPYPVAGRTAPPGEHVATLVLSRGATAAPER